MSDLYLPPLDAEAPPLKVWDGGIVRVGNSRVSLDTVMEQYRLGRTPEQIAEDYDTLKLPDIYGAIAFALRHPEQVREYLAQREQAADALQAEQEARHPPLARAELMARWRAREEAHAAAGE